MTPEQRLYFDHVRRGGDLVFDQVLARAVLASFARLRGNTFTYLEIP